MASLAELARARTRLDEDAIGHLQRLVASWALPCDLSFGDLLLYAPTDPEASSFVVLGHVRSTTGSTVHRGDPVAATVSAVDRPLLARCQREGRPATGLVARTDPLTIGLDDAVAAGGDDTVEEDIALRGTVERLVVDYVPVRMNDRVVAVLTREGERELIRHRSPTEVAYRDLWERFAAMIAEGAFPLATQERVGQFREPRVGDGVLIFDRVQRVEFASPNAVSALHRLGVQANVEGRTLADLGIDDAVVRHALSTRHSTVTELEGGADLTVVLRCYPLIDQGRATGALAVLRDVTEVRSRDRLLVSKDTTIREIHHRVKNNLHTIQSLLRLQARRLESPEARDAVVQSARRIGSIAIVHETLSTDATDVVEFDEVVGRVVRMVEEGFASEDRPLRVAVDGSLGALPGDVAMPLAVALTELVQNAIDHAAPSGADVAVELHASRRELIVRVRNGGSGVPEGFSLDRDAGLGLTIVRTFVVHDLGGTISIGPARDENPRGAVVEVRIPRRAEALPIG